MRTARLALSIVSSVFALSLGCSTAVTPADVAPTDAASALVTDAVTADANVTSDARAPLAHGTVLQEGSSWLVLAQREDDPSDGSFTEHPASEFHQAISRPIAHAALGSFATPRSVRVFRGSQWVCDADVEAPVVLSVAEKGYDEDGSPMARELHEVWESGLRAIAAKLTVTRGDCASGEWAQDSSLAAPVFAAPTAVDPSTSELAWAAIRASAQGQKLHEDHMQLCAAEGSCATRWDLRSDVERTIRVFTTREGRRVVFAAIRSTEGCGAFGAELTMIANLVTEGGRAVIRDAVFSEEPTTDPDAFVEGARLEWRSHSARMFIDAARALVVERVDVPVFGCGC